MNSDVFFIDMILIFYGNSLKVFKFSENVLSKTDKKTIYFLQCEIGLEVKYEIK